MKPITDAHELFRHRHAIRSFTDEDVSDELVNRGRRPYYCPTCDARVRGVGVRLKQTRKLAQRRARPASSAGVR